VLRLNRRVQRIGPRLSFSAASDQSPVGDPVNFLSLSEHYFNLMLSVPYADRQSVETSAARAPLCNGSAHED
jgi:hypothetical protein